MSKRRTRKQKERAIHHFIFNPKDSLEKKHFEPRVKGQIKNQVQADKEEPMSSKNAIFLAKEESLASIKHNIKKSIILASFILALELVIYLAWNVK
jgi:hypothetical protein